MKINLIRLAQRPVPIRLGYFVSTLLLLWLPFAIPIYLLVSDSNSESILTMVLLYAEFIFLLQLWGKNVYQQPQIFKQYGLEITQINAVDLLSGLATGIISILVVFGLQGFLGWLVWQQPQVFLPKIILEGLIVSLAIGFAEELLFRGWLLDELQRDYSRSVALWINAVAFAVLHFIKPLEAIIHTLPQFPALVLLGLTQVWAKRWRRGRLGLPIGLHGGLVWGYYIINVGQLIEYSGQVPDWITGVNQNPLQGVMGVVFMGILALWMRWQAIA
ncbi:MULTISPECIES: CPBP family intramembrane glutamic endopeptidase [Cyanophyceae]|uniref:CPBP family intramembrane glutamic endopeptidase n=1 Tax=Cyanophyceae TaxID=3028117 RepID=UPI00232DC506|nr:MULTISPECIES: type II CAAX endopeptidase family protein [Cyanophyceae]MDB9338063.1 type II CAAX endopeptidase family protein [Nodularia spumigena CS-589/07]MDB9343207.1 type II CAAX endopeptidase family protein [Nodularia spumigena CS-588/06]MDB9371723.1 type II CAAX endopeptidase family protein [Nodularia spumigena CS-586/05]MDB9402106.1 type II CAAX endopeptidase family protein [Microcystis aeruginosa CS-567/02-A1]MDB9498225.1 type II CAAX endopeptidase family protein [Nodularia spumigena